MHKHPLQPLANGFTLNAIFPFGSQAIEEIFHREFTRLAVLLSRTVERKRREREKERRWNVGDEEESKGLGAFDSAGE